jgi:putative hydrolase of the HAD superfamily
MFIHTNKREEYIMNKIKLFIFDMGGVMCTNSNVTPDICEKLNLSKRKFLEFATHKNLKAIQTGELVAEEFWSKFSEKSGMQIESDYFYDFFKPIRRKEMYELIEKIKTNGFRVVLGTNTIDSHYNKHTKNGDYDIFEKVYPSNLIGYSKPDPEFLNFILNKENQLPENTVFVDDNEENIISAKSIGINAIHYDEFKNVNEKIEKILKDISE